MSAEQVKAYVSKADGKEIRVHVLDASFESEVLKLGFSFKDELSSYSLSISSDTEKAEIFSELQRADVCFSAGKEWCPSEVFEFLRDKKMLVGNFKRISWKGKSEYTVTIS